MNIDPHNLTLTHFKAIGVDAFDKLNGVTTSTPPSNLIFTKSTDDEKVLLIDSLSKSGLLMNKFLLSSLFPSILDIRPYKEGLFRHQKELTSFSNLALTNKYSTTLTVVDFDILDTATSFDTASVKDFLTFCRVFGFYELTLSDVHLSTIDGKLIISVNSTHDYFTGFIEVLV